MIKAQENIYRSGTWKIGVWDLLGLGFTKLAVNDIMYVVIDRSARSLPFFYRGHT
jgi:hypothetical protein